MTVYDTYYKHCKKTFSYKIVPYLTAVNFETYAWSALNKHSTNDFSFMAGFSEIVGVFMGYSLILNCKKKWQYAGMFNIFAGLFASIGYFYPNSCESQ